MSSNKGIKVFVSYSHEDEKYEQKIYEFVNRLRQDGIDANVDLYVTSPKEGWQRWMEKQIRISDFVIVIFSKSYYKKCYIDDEAGKGISWEVNIIYQHLYDNFSENTKFIPTFFSKDDERYVLTPLKPFTYFNIGSDTEYEKLYRYLRGVEKYQKPHLGKLRPLKQKEQKTMFFSTPIDIRLWDLAKWRGMIYLFSFRNMECPRLGILFDNLNAGKQIFENWMSAYPFNSIDDNIEITFIEPPFPIFNFIYSDEERNFGKGYWVHIGPNVDKSLTRMRDNNIPLESGFVATFSRYHWMSAISGHNNLEIFKECIDRFNKFEIVPVGILDKNMPIAIGNLDIDDRYIITMTNVNFVKGTDVTKDDIYDIVLSSDPVTL